MSKSKISGYFLVLAISTFLSILFVMIQKGYSNIMKYTDEGEDAKLTKPINPSLDTDFFKVIEEKKEYEYSVFDQKEIGDIVEEISDSSSSAENAIQETD